MRTNSSLVKGLAILEMIINEGSVRIADVSKRFNIQTSNVTLFMNALVMSGYVFKNNMDGKYYLTSKLMDQINQAGDLNYKYIYEIALPEMEKLHDKYHENVLVAVLEGMITRFIGKIQANHIIQVINQTDKVFSPHVTANGKAMLAYLPEDFLNRYLRGMDHTAYTKNTIVDTEKLKSELELIRKTGYSKNVGEFQENLMAVSSPIFQGDRVVASIVVQFPDFRHKPEDLDKHGYEIKKAAMRISEKLS